MPTIFWAGDSTVQYNDITTYPQTGIGQVLHLFLKPDVKVENHAKNGRSTKSFIDESRMPAIYDRITEGDFLFVQFGHNDEKIEDPDRYTEPFSDFMINLEKFVNVARNKKAYPVLITPIERRGSFIDETTLGPGAHGDYVEAMKQTAKNLNVPLIDLHSMSRAELTRVGAEASKDWYMHIPEGKYPYHMEGLADNTHLKYAGAVVFAGCIARGLRDLGGIYKDLLLDEL